MSEDGLDTAGIQQCVARWQGGDREAGEQLVQVVGKRLESMTRKILRKFPDVHAWTETADVVQSSLLRLLNTLRRIEPESTRHFYNLAALHVRRELLDLARYFKRGKFARPPASGPADESDAIGGFDPADGNADDDLELWTRFHEAVEQLPTEEREVMGLVFYHGLTQAQIAELYQVDERTIRRYWQSACLQLHRLMGDELPQP